MNGSEQGEKDVLIVEYLVAPPTASPSNILVAVAVAVVEEEESTFSLLPILRENMEVMAPKIPPSSCDDDNDDDLDLLFEDSDDLLDVAVSSICSRATRRARNSRQSSPIIFSHVFSMRARSLSLDKWRQEEMVAVVMVGDGNRCRMSDEKDNCDDGFGGHLHDVAVAGTESKPPNLDVNAADSSTTSRRRTATYLALRSVMMALTITM